MRTHVPPHTARPLPRFACVASLAALAALAAAGCAEEEATVQLPQATFGTHAAFATESTDGGVVLHPLEEGVPARALSAGIVPSGYVVESVRGTLLLLGLDDDESPRLFRLDAAGRALPDSLPEVDAMPLVETGFGVLTIEGEIGADHRVRVLGTDLRLDTERIDPRDPLSAAWLSTDDGAAVVRYLDGASGELGSMPVPADLACIDDRFCWLQRVEVGLVSLGLATQHFGEDGSLIQTAEVSAWGAWVCGGDALCTVEPGGQLTQWRDGSPIVSETLAVPERAHLSVDRAAGRVAILVEEDNVDGGRLVEVSNWPNHEPVTILESTRGRLNMVALDVE